MMLRGRIARRLCAGLAVLSIAGYSGIALGADQAKKHHKPKRPTVSLRKTSLGMVLVGVGGRTLYLHSTDKGLHSTCKGACLVAWPAFKSRVLPKAGKGVKQKLFKLNPKVNGGQVSYGGHLLYYFKFGGGPGDVSGQGVASFFVVSASGHAIH